MCPTSSSRCCCGRRCASGRAAPRRPILVVCSITVWNTAQNAGPFVRDSITDSLLATQLFIAISALTSLVLAAVTAERTRVAAALAESDAAQRALADEQAALRRVATLVASGAPPSRVFEQVTEEVARLLGMPGASLMRYDGARTATVVGALERGRQAEPARRAARSISTATPSSRRSCAAASRSASTDTRTRAVSWRSTLQRSATARRWRRPSPWRGELWGALAAATRSSEPLPEGLEQRLSRLRRPRRAGARQRRRARAARRVARADRRGRRRRAPAARAQPPRRRAATARLARPRPAHGRRDAREGSRRPLADLATAQEQLAEGLEELRELARGIHPAILTERGLGPALRGAARAGAAARRDHRDTARSGSRRRSRRPRTTSSPRRSPTWSSTRGRRT